MPVLKVRPRAVYKLSPRIMFVIRTAIERAPASSPSPPSTRRRAPGLGVARRSCVRLRAWHTPKTHAPHLGARVRRRLTPACARDAWSIFKIALQGVSFKSARIQHIAAPRLGCACSVALKRVYDTYVVSRRRCLRAKRRTQCVDDVASREARA